MALQEQQLSAALEDVTRQLNELSSVLPNLPGGMSATATESTAMAKGLSVAGQAAGKMAGAFTSAMGSMYEGKKGLKAFDGAIDKTADALMILTGALALIGGPITLLAAGLTAAVGAGAKYVKAANEQSDKLFEAYRGMAQAGAAAQDGLQGLYNDVKRLGGGIQDLDEFVSLVASSSQSLASFSGTVFGGRKEFAKMAHEMKPFRLGMEQAGISQKAQNEATMSYIRLQSRVGLTQNKNTIDLAESARKYIYEQDRLTKLTGLNAKEQEDIRVAARNKETFAATLLELRNRGDEKSIQASKNLENTFVVLQQHSKELGEGFLDSTLRTEAAQKLSRATNGESMRVQQDLKAGLITDVQALDRLKVALNSTVKVYGVTMGNLGNFNNYAGDLPGAISFISAGAKGFEKSLAKITNAQEEQGLFGDKALDDEVNRQAKLRLTQVDAMQNMQDFVRRGVTPATNATAFFGRVVEKVTKLFKGSDSLAKEYDAERLVQQREEQVSKAYEELIDARAANEIVEESNNEKDKETARINLEAAKSKFATAKIERDAANAALLAIKTPPAASARRPTGRTQGQSTPGAKLSPGEAQAILEGGSERDIASFGGREALARIAGLTKSSAPAAPPAAPPAAKARTLAAPPAAPPAAKASTPAAPPAAKASKPTLALPLSSAYPSSGPISGAKLSPAVAKATKTQEEQGLFGDTALDDEVNRQAKLRLTQEDAMQNMQDFVRRGVTPATSATAFFGRVIEKTTKLFNGSDSLAKDYNAERLVQRRQEKVSEAYENLMNARTAVELAEEKSTAEDQKIKNEELTAAKEKFAAAVAERKAAEQALQDLRTGKKSVGTTSVGTTKSIPTTSVASGSSTGSAIAKGTQQLLNPQGVIAEPTLAQLQSSQAYIAARRSGIDSKAALQAAKDSFAAGSKASSSTYPSSGPTSGAQPAAGSKASSSTYPSSGPTSAAQPAAGADGNTSSPEQSGGVPTTGAQKTTGEAPIAKIIDSRPGEITVATTDGQQQKRQGTANWRMNNPGNLRMTPWTKGQGGVVGEGDAGPSGKFAVFSTLADGRKAKENLLFGGRTVYGNLDLRSAMYKYAPPSDNNPTEGYLQSILQATGASDTTKLAEMSQNQRDSMLAAIEKFEGFKPGKIYAAAEGGIVREKLGGTMVWAGEAGQDEAVVPLKNGNIPVSFTGTDSIAEALKRITDEFKSSLNQIANSMRNNQQSVLNEEALEILRGIESATKNSAGIQDQLLRVAQN